MQTGEGAERGDKGGGRVHATRDSITIELPRLDPGLREFISEMVPGRALLRVLTHMPEDVITHTRNARRERLLALRSLIDGLIEETDKPAPRQRAREVEIE